MEVDASFSFFIYFWKKEENIYVAWSLIFKEWIQNLMTSLQFFHFNITSNNASLNLYVDLGERSDMSPVKYVSFLDGTVLISFKKFNIYINVPAAHRHLHPLNCHGRISPQVWAILDQKISEKLWRRKNTLWSCSTLRVRRFLFLPFHSADIWNWEKTRLSGFTNFWVSLAWLKYQMGVRLSEPSVITAMLCWT